MTVKNKESYLLFSRFGVILFSLSIYLLATNNLTSFDFKVIGFVTPIGGLTYGLGRIIFHF
jgi:uncharacterized membrane protein YgdD (TMEM256/DUF423 family)